MGRLMPTSSPCRGHAPSWLSTDFISKDVVVEYETPWWTVAKKVDEFALRDLVASGDDRDVDVVDANGRTALLFVAGLGSESCVNLLVEADANMDHRDRIGVSRHFTWRQVRVRDWTRGVVRVLEGLVFKYVEVREILERGGFVSVWQRGEEW
ncbi:hypothetical protein ACSQ67_010474 [Phaseolus vulgaris]